MIRLSICFLLILATFTTKADGKITSKDSIVPVLHLKGKPYDRGFTHGSLKRKEINEVYKKWKQSIQKDSGKDADEVIKDFLKTSDYKKAIEKWTPEIFEEIKGIAAGSKQTLDDVFAFQMIDEYWGYLDRLKHHSIDKDHCSAIGVAKSTSHPTIVAQNIDIDNFMNGYQVLLHIEEDNNSPEQYIMSCAGFIGFAGMNKNVAVVINALTDLNNSVSGLPVTFVTRGILQKKSGKEALEFLNKVNHATGQNYLIGTEDKVYTFEASANQVVQFDPYNDKLVYHTNHSLINNDIKPWMVEYHRRILSGLGKKTNSQTRLASLESQLSKAGEDINAEKIKEILRSKENAVFPICVSYKEGGVAFTFSSVVFNLGKIPFAEVTYGAPDQSEFQKHFFNK